MDINNLVLSDEAVDLINNGTWVSDLPGAPGVRLRVLGWGAKEVQAFVESEKVQARISNKGEPLTTEQLSDITCKALAEVVLTDWEGLTDNGKPLKYSKELATQFLMSDNGDRFAGLVLEASQRLDRRVNDFVGAALKNS